MRDLVVSTAAADVLLAEVGVYVAMLACATPAAPFSCPAVALAYGALAVATTKLAIATAKLVVCQSSNPISREGARSGSPSCYTVVWEISYDGGLTWHFLDQVRVCSDEAVAP